MGTALKVISPESKYTSKLRLARRFPVNPPLQATTRAEPGMSSGAPTPHTLDRTVEPTKSVVDPATWATRSTSMRVPVVRALSSGDGAGPGVVLSALAHGDQPPPLSMRTSKVHPSPSHIRVHSVTGAGTRQPRLWSVELA